VEIPASRFSGRLRKSFSDGARQKAFGDGMQASVLSASF